MLQHICCDLYYNCQAFKVPNSYQKGKISILIGAETEECQLKIYVQFYQHPSYPQSQRVLEICSNEIGLDIDMGNAYAPSYYGCRLIRKCACHLTENHLSSSRLFF